jgi:hypothetical protein
MGHKAENSAQADKSVKKHRSLMIQAPAARLVRMNWSIIAVPAGLNSWFPIHFTKNVKWMGHGEWCNFKRSKT